MCWRAAFAPWPSVYSNDLNTVESARAYFLGKEEWNMISLAFRFLRDDQGATAIEYALLASLVALAIVASLNAVAVRLNFVFSEVASALK
jgi:pilus assembly protein Flp/PilA